MLVILNMTDCMKGFVSQSGLLSDILDVVILYGQRWSPPNTQRRRRSFSLKAPLCSLRHFCRGCCALTLTSHHVSRDTIFTGTFKVRSVKPHLCPLRRVFLLLPIQVQNRSYGGRRRTNNAVLECRIILKSESCKATLVEINNKTMKLEIRGMVSLQHINRQKPQTWGFPSLLPSDGPTFQKIQNDL